MPIVCALDRGPKKASLGPGGRQAGGKEHVSVSETLEVREVRGQSSGLVRRAVGRVGGRNEAQRKRCGFSQRERGGTARPGRKSGAQASSFLSRGFCEHEPVCVCVCVCVRRHMESGEQCEWNERTVNVERTGWKEEATRGVRRSLGYSGRKAKT